MTKQHELKRRLLDMRLERNWLESAVWTGYSHTRTCYIDDLKKRIIVAEEQVKSLIL